MSDTGKNRKTILLVEDDALVAVVQKRLLERTGYNVISVPSGEKAVSVVLSGNNPADLILMDIDLGPGIDGTVAARQILNEKDIPVVFLSSHTEPEIVEKTEKITSYGYVVKDSGFTVLDASIKMAFRLFEARAREREQCEILSATSSRLEGMLNALPDLMFEAGIDGLLYTSDLQKYAMPVLAGGDFNGKNVRDILPRDVADVIMAAIREADEKGISTGMQYRLELSGAVYWHELSVSRMQVPSTCERRFICLARDITERRNFEGSLRQSEERYRMLIETANEGIWAMDRDHVTTYVNQAMADMLGYSPSEMLGKKVEDFFFPEDMSFHEGRMMLRHMGKDEVYERRFRRRDGSQLWTLVSAKVITDEKGGFAGSFAMFTDITESKRADDNIRKERDRLINIFNSLPDGVYIVDKQHRIEYINPVIEREFGPVNGRRCYEYFHNGNEKCTWCKNDDVFSGRSVRWEWYSDRNGRFYDLFDMPFTNTDGSISKLEIFHDITERKQAEDIIRHQIRDREILLKEVHHRIKNNITTIGSMLRLKAETVRNGESRNILQDAISRVESMRIIYEKLLLTDDYIEIPVREYIENLAVAIMDIFPEKDKVKLEYNIHDVILDVKTVFYLGIIVNELISNSMKYGFINRDSGRITISLMLNESEITMSVHDNGRGIPENFNLKGSSGFGLMIISMLLEQLEGTFIIENCNGTRGVVQFRL